MGHPGLLVEDYVAGIPIWYIPNNTFINQAKYTQDMLKRFKMDFGVKGAKTPMPTKVTLELS
jgi:hypothetical protein